MKTLQEYLKNEIITAHDAVKAEEEKIKELSLIIPIDVINLSYSSARLVAEDKKRELAITRFVVHCPVKDVLSLCEEHSDLPTNLIPGVYRDKCTVTVVERDQLLSKFGDVFWRMRIHEKCVTTPKSLKNYFCQIIIYQEKAVTEMTSRILDEELYLESVGTLIQKLRDTRRELERILKDFAQEFTVAEVLDLCTKAPKGKWETLRLPVDVLEMVYEKKTITTAEKEQLKKVFRSELRF